MNGAWLELKDELERWSGAGSTATFWWRDDDAITATQQLDVLLRHALAVPVALAVIPDLVTADLAARLRNERSVSVLQHGWRHFDHAAGGRNEYPASRARHEVAAEFATGRERLAQQFGDRFLAVFVPPWHGFDDCFLPLLAQNGFTSISRKGPRPSQFAAEGIAQVNAHVAPIRWTTPPSFGTDDQPLAIIVDHLRGRRTGRYDRDEPTGLLTHHLVQNERSYAFVARLVELIHGHPAAKWLDAHEVFQPSAKRCSNLT